MSKPDVAEVLDGLRPAERSAELQCTWRAWRVLAAGELALEMPRGNCCDMRGAIAIAERLMPGVWRIATLSGGVPDVEYRNHSGEWQAFDNRNFR